MARGICPDPNCDGGAVGDAEVLPSDWPATYPNTPNTTAAVPIAEIQGHGRLGCSRCPTGVPQEWQNLAPLLSGALHEGQVAPASGAAQWLQNRPDAGSPQLGHAVVFMEVLVEVFV